jgi:hypothetical protein
MLPRLTPRRLAALAVAVMLPAALLLAQGHDVVLPYVPPPEDNSKLSDPVTRFARRLKAGGTPLTVGQTAGVLPALLRDLQIPVSSQVLVFSKTSLQYEFISPRMPRAIYFNDDVYVGFVPESDTVELSSVDPDIGAVFYTLRQRAGAQPALVTGPRCLQCHAIPATLAVPGHLFRSVFVRGDGNVAPNTPGFLTDDRSPFEERWGGWFVSGTVGANAHMGNALLPTAQNASAFDRQPGSAIADVSRMFRSDLYLTPHSDVVALMVLGHQVRMHNLITRLHRSTTSTPTAPAAADMAPFFPTVDAQIDELLRYMLFVEEAPLRGTISGSTTFAADFARRGPADSRGRSLRQLDLETRLFRYPCSYLIYSSAFLALPADVKRTIYGRLDDVLAGRNGSATFARLTPADRAAIAEILRATHPEFTAATIRTARR